MSSSKSIVHLTSSALAGAPARLVDALNEHTPYRATLLRKGRISERQRAFEPNAVAYNAPSGLSWELCCELVSEADVVHVHNQAPIEALRLLAHASPTSALVYHFHSPPAERPNFFDHSRFLPTTPDALVTVPHFHPRCYQDAVMLPNVVVASALPPRRTIGKPRVVLSPSHESGGRWNTKIGPRTRAALTELQNAGRVDISTVSDLAPRELLQLRSLADISIDEVETGSYHQVSLEALAAGSVPINDADRFSLASFAVAYGTDEPPPFVRTSPALLASTIHDLAADTERLWQMRLEAQEYFETHMTPRMVAARYQSLYDSL